MAEVLLVFGSKSDFAVYEPIFNYFKEKKISCDFATISAHREPDKLKEKISSTDAKVIVAGAGLSAALPGVIASLIDKPVIGVPVNANYSGLDAMLSIMQMPSGKPVLCAGVNQGLLAAEYAKKMLETRFRKVVIIKRDNCDPINKAVEKAETELKNANVEYEIASKIEYKDDAVVYLDFLQLDKIKSVNPEGKMVFFVPCKTDSSAKDALKILELSKNGLWLGLNRGDNAALSAVKLIKS